MIILDTNVLSALMRTVPEQAVVSWLDEQPRMSIWTTSITVLEIRFGILLLQAGKRQSHLLTAFDSLLDLLDHRIVHFDAAAAEQAAQVSASRHRRGRVVDLRDTMIAGIVLSRRAKLATRNTGHFDDLSLALINPWIA